MRGAFLACQSRCQPFVRGPGGRRWGGVSNRASFQIAAVRDGLPCVSTLADLHIIGSDMLRKWLVLAAVAIGVTTGPLSHAQNVIVYPARGQSQDTQDQDRYACHSWAVQQSGYDPS